MTAVLVGGADRHARFAVDAHTASCGRCAQAYDDLIAASVAVDRAYAPLRAATISLSPARIYLAARAPRTVPASIRLSRLTARFSEVALAAAVTAFAFVGSASVEPKASIVDEASAPDAPTHVTAHLDDQNFIRWFRIGRYAASPDLVDPAVALPRTEIDDPVTHERAGLVR